MRSIRRYEWCRGLKEGKKVCGGRVRRKKRKGGGSAQVKMAEKGESVSIGEDASGRRAQSVVRSLEGEVRLLEREVTYRLIQRSPAW